LILPPFVIEYDAVDGDRFAVVGLSVNKTLLIISTEYNVPYTVQCFIWY